MWSPRSGELRPQRWQQQGSLEWRVAAQDLTVVPGVIVPLSWSRSWACPHPCPQTATTRALCTGHSADQTAAEGLLDSAAAPPCLPQLSGVPEEDSPVPAGQVPAGESSLCPPGPRSPAIKMTQGQVPGTQPGFVVGSDSAQR